MAATHDHIDTEIVIESSMKLCEYFIEEIK